MKIEIDKELLERLYLNENKSSQQIAKLLGCSAVTVISRMKEHNIPIRTASQRKQGVLNPSYGKLGENSPRWNMRHSQETKVKISLKVPRGTGHFRWKEPSQRIERVNVQIRTSTHMKRWRLRVLERDNHVCVFCGETQDLHVDHIVPFSEIKRRNNIVSLRDAITVDELWDTNNGRTLCKACHEKTPTWGNRKKST